MTEPGTPVYTLSQTRVLTEAEVAQRLDLATAVEWVEKAFESLGKGHAEVVPRSRAQCGDGVFHILAGTLPSARLVGAKLYTTIVRPTGESRSSCLVLFDTTGARIAVIESYQLSLVRTAACTAVATRHLAPKRASTLGIIGTGSTAALQLQAVARERPFERVLVHSRSAEHRRRLVDEVSPLLTVDVHASASAEALVRESDVVITATNSATPVIDPKWLRPQVLINAIGSNFPDRRELPASLLAEARAIFVDSIDAARREAGDLILAEADGAIAWESVEELGPVVAGRRRIQSSDEDTGAVVFKSVGVVPLDLAMAASVLADVAAAAEMR